MSDAAILRERRFAVRFLGRRGTWLWLAATLGPGTLSWLLLAPTLRGFAGSERTWFLWSGNVVLALFVATMLFVLRKWSVKLPAFRDLGRAPASAVDACWAEIQVLNRKVREGAYGSDAEILAAAQGILRRFQVERVERAEVATAGAGAAAVKYVRLRKREPLGRLEPWLEMHMGVGVAACVGVWFHADGILRHPIGWTLFAASMVVLATGVLGAVLYRALPERLAAEGAEIPFEEAGVARENYERSLAGMLAAADPAVRQDLEPLLRRARSAEEMRRRAEDLLGRVAAKSPQHLELARDLAVLAGTRDALLLATAAARRTDLWLKVWRWVHVPVSTFLFFVIALHVWVVLWY